MSVASHTNNFPKLHNAAWPGVVGKGEGSEPAIPLDTMLDLTAAAEVDGIKFDGVDLFLFAPHVDIDSSDDDLKTLADKVKTRGTDDRLGRRPDLAPDRGRSGDGRGGRADQVPQAGPLRVAGSRQKLRELGVRPYGVVRFDSATGVGGLVGRSRRVIRPGSPRPSSRPARSPATTASGSPPRGKSAGAGCTRGDRWSTSSNGWASPRPSDFRPTWRIPCSTPWARTPPTDRILPDKFDWKDRATLDSALRTLTTALRPWTIDFHVAQNDATVFGSGSHDHTGSALPGDRPQRQARHPARRRILAPRRERATLPRRSATSAGTAACSPTR